MSRVSGGKKAAAKLLAKDPDFYRKIGSIGGKVRTKKGFAISGLASEAGRKGGQVSRRGKAIEHFHNYDILPN